MLHHREVATAHDWGPGIDDLHRALIHAGAARGLIWPHFVHDYVFTQVHITSQDPGDGLCSAIATDVPLIETFQAGMAEHVW